MPTDPLGLVDHTLLGRYYVEAPLAQGGMGAVYRGVDLRLRRPVCIKIFHRLSSSDVVYRASYDHFVQEAYALSRLSHPNTLRIYDFGHLMDDSLAPFQVSELLDGGTLGQWVRREGPRSPAEMFGLIGPVAGALSEAHARGIIHRDVKPSNIILGLLGSRRVAKLGDFGIAQTGSDLSPARLRSEDVQARAGMRLYSMGWAAPEQLKGEPALPATDVFALGLVTAFVLSGRPVFSPRGELDADSKPAESDAFVACRLEEMELPRELAEVLATACRACPGERFSSAEGFSAALAEAVDAATRRLGSVGRAAGVPGICGEAKSGVTLSSLLIPADDSEPRVMMRARERQAPPPPLLPPGGTKPAARPRKDRGTRETNMLVDCESDREISVLGRHLTLIEVRSSGQLDLGGPTPRLASKARFRVTLLPSRLPVARINVKGLNCFVARAEARPAAAINLDENTVLELLAEDRLILERIVCSLGRPSGGDQLCRFGARTLCVRGAAAGAALLDLGPGRELVLIHRGMPALRHGGST